MKKILLFVSAILFAGHAFSQSVEDFVGDLPATDNTMSLVFPTEVLGEYEGDVLLAYANGDKVSNPTTITSGNTNLSIQGASETLTTGATAGDVLSFAILHNGVIIVINSYEPDISYTPNEMVVVAYDAYPNDCDPYDLGADPDCISILDVAPNTIVPTDPSELETWKQNSSLVSNGMEVTFKLQTSNADVVFGCTDDSYAEYNDLANLDDGSCSVVAVFGCTNSDACNFDLLANTDDNSCQVVDSPCEECDGDVVALRDADGDGYCDLGSGLSPEEIPGSQDATACNYNAEATEEDNSGVYADDPCEICENGAVALYDADTDGYCDLGSGLSPEEVLGCNDVTAFNHSSDATEDDGSCYAVIEGCTNPNAVNYNDLDADGKSDPITGDVHVDINTDDGSCTIDGILPWGPGSTGENDVTFVTSNNMSILFPAENSGVWDENSNIENGDVIFAAYATEFLTNDTLGYSAVKNAVSGGAIVFDGSSKGMSIFGMDPDRVSNPNGFYDGQELIWIVVRGPEYFHATVEYADEFAGTYDDGAFAAVSKVTVGAPFNDGCTDPNYFEYNPMAGNDDGSCTTYISIGCMDEQAVNFAGPGANPTHNNANNIGTGAAFVENVSINLNDNTNGSGTGEAANFHSQAMCQTQVEGCMQYMAHNYNPMNTINVDTECDFSLNGMLEYDIDAYGNSLETTYSFGYINTDPQDASFSEIVESDFDNANVVFTDDRVDFNPYNHVIDNLSALMDWVDLDEVDDAQELADTIIDMQDRYDANHANWMLRYDTLETNSEYRYDTLQTNSKNRYDSLDIDWTNRYNFMESSLLDTISFVRDSAEVDFAIDEANDAQELADSIAAGKERFDAMVIAKDEIIAHLRDSAAILHHELLVRFYGDDKSHVAGTDVTYYPEGTFSDAEGEVGALQEALDYHRSSINIDLHTHWNMIAYTLHHESSVQAQFAANFDVLGAAAHINIVKNNRGDFWWPDFNFDGLGNLIPGQGYQVRVKDASPGKADFTFRSYLAPAGDNSRMLIPTVPQWAVDMEVDQHPNDIRTLVRVVNMLGQEVNPADAFNGEVLLYLYNDGTVEKKMTK